MAMWCVMRYAEYYANEWAGLIALIVCGAIGCRGCSWLLVVINTATMLPTIIHSDDSTVVLNGVGNALLRWFALWLGTRLSLIWPAI